MRISMIAPSYLPARRANTVQVMKMAQAFARNGCEIEVTVPSEEDESISWDRIAHHYGLQTKFAIKWLKVKKTYRGYDYALKGLTRARKLNADLIYTRLPQAAAIASLLGFSTALEMHDFPQGRMGPILFRLFLMGKGAAGIVSISSSLANDLWEHFPINDENIPLLVKPDGVDIDRYQQKSSPEESRVRLRETGLDIPADRFTVGYTGHLYPGRGVEIILYAASRLPEMNFLLVGGEDKDIRRIESIRTKRGLENLTLAGFVPNSELPEYQSACEVLTMPYQTRISASSGGDISRYLSPMKLFEYMAAGRVIISSDLPVLREVLNEDNAVLVPADDVNSWIAAISDMRGTYSKYQALAERALKDVIQYTWEARVKDILEIVQKNYVKASK